MMLGRRRRQAAREALARASERGLAHPPVTSELLGYGATLPLLAGAVAAHTLSGRARIVAVEASSAWAGAILCFLGGVRRGLSFDEPGGAPRGELGTMLAHFAFGLGGLVRPGRPASLAALAAGYAAVGLFDREGAEEGEAPAYFARLRPAQAAIALFALAALTRAGRGRD